MGFELLASAAHLEYCPVLKSKVYYILKWPPLCHTENTNYAKKLTSLKMDQSWRNFIWKMSLKSEILWRKLVKEGDYVNSNANMVIGLKWGSLPPNMGGLATMHWLMNLFMFNKICILFLYFQLELMHISQHSLVWDNCRFALNEHPFNSKGWGTMVFFGVKFIFRFVA